MSRSSACTALVDLTGADPAAAIGLPGEPPFTRGIHPTGYRSRLWTMRMFAGFGAAEDTNARFRPLLAAGQTGLSIAYDMPTLYGYDTDDPEAEGEFGTCGVAVSSLADMEVLLAGLPLDQVSTSMTINSPAAPIWAMYIAAAEKRGVPRAALEGTTQNDILKEFVAQKEFLFPPAPSMRLVTDTIEFGTRELPRWNTISISGYHIREAGSTAVQELAFTIADGMAYVEAALARGLRIDDFAPRLSFFFNSHSDFFEEIAKFRASRRIWYRLMTERYHAENERSTWMRFHTQTAGVSLTAQQPLNNLTRVAIQALAAVLGGTQSLHTDAYDEAWAVPSAEAALLALRQQQVIAEETGVTNTVDPLGGSWFVEAPDRSDGAGRLALHRGDRPPREAWSPRSPRAIRSARSPMRPTGSSVNSMPGSGASSGSTGSPTRTRNWRSRCSRWPTRHSAPRCRAWSGRDVSGTARPSRPRSPACAKPPGVRARVTRTSCPISCAARTRTRRSANSAASCAKSSGSTGSRSRSDHRPARSAGRRMPA